QHQPTHTSTLSNPIANHLRMLLTCSNPEPVDEPCTKLAPIKLPSVDVTLLDIQPKRQPDAHRHAHPVSQPGCQPGAQPEGHPPGHPPGQPHHQRHNQSQCDLDPLPPARGSTPLMQPEFGLVS